MEKYPWRNREWLYGQYVEDEKGMSQIANEVDTSPATIHDWLDRHGIESRSKELPDNHPVNEKNKIQELHCERNWNVHKIAKELGVSRDAVKKRLDKFGIERQHHPAEEWGRGVFFYTGKDGYERCGASNREEKTTVSFHKLMACIDHDPARVFDSGISVHHKNKIPWDNRIENLDLLSLEEHSKHHMDNGDLHNLDKEGYNS
jgi:transposase-like protein